MASITRRQRFTDLAERVLAESDPTNIDYSLWRDIYDALHEVPPHVTLSQELNAATMFKVIEQILPEWGVQVGHPIRSYAPYGWYASVFRGASARSETYQRVSFSQDGSDHTMNRYAATPANALLACLCRALASLEPE